MGQTPGERTTKAWTPATNGVPLLLGIIECHQYFCLYPHSASICLSSYRMEKEIAATIQQTETLNQSRKLQQLELKKALTALEEEWQSTVRKNVAIEAECVALEARIAALRTEKGCVCGGVCCSAALLTR